MTQPSTQDIAKAADHLAEAHELPGGLFDQQTELSDCVREYRRGLESQPCLSLVPSRLQDVPQQTGAGR